MKLFVLLTLLILISSCKQEEQECIDPILETSEIEDVNSTETTDQVDSLVTEETEFPFQKGRHIKRNEEGTITLSIRPKSASTFEFVFDTWSGTNGYAKLAGEVELDNDGHGTFTSPNCKILDFQFNDKGVRLKEYQCNFHSKNLPFDGFYIPWDKSYWENFDGDALVSAIQKNQIGFDLYASFTEPFFTVFIAGDVVVIDHMDEPTEVYEVTSIFDPNKDEQRIILNKGNKTRKLLIKKGNGSDGMSDIDYAYSVILDDEYYGGGDTQLRLE